MPLTYACLAAAAATHSLPVDALIIVLDVERGQVGMETKNPNRTVDLGPMQINSIHVPEISKLLQVPPQQAWTLLRDDACLNAQFAAMLISRHLKREGNLVDALSAYHSRTPTFRDRYLNRLSKSAVRLFSKN